MSADSPLTIATCRDPKTGQAIFEERLAASDGYYASPVAGGGRVYLASDRGIITVLEATNQLQVIRSIDLREPIQATPALVDGKLYVRTAKHLMAFGE